MIIIDVKENDGQTTWVNSSINNRSPNQRNRWIPSIILIIRSTESSGITDRSPAKTSINKWKFSQQITRNGSICFYKVSTLYKCKDKPFLWTCWKTLMSNPPENLPLSPFKEHKSQIPCQSLIPIKISR